MSIPSTTSSPTFQTCFTYNSFNIQITHTARPHTKQYISPTNQSNMSLGGSELDLSKDLASLSEADKRELQQWANNENQKANIQESAFLLYLSTKHFLIHHGPFVSSVPFHNFIAPSEYISLTCPISQASTPSHPCASRNASPARSNPANWTATKRAVYRTASAGSWIVIC